MDANWIDARDEAPNEVQLDATDLLIIRTLAGEARLPNKELAARVGVAPSTCLTRIRALRNAGVIRGFRADIDLERVGLRIVALISVRVNPHARRGIRDKAKALCRAPETLEVFQLAGDRDLLIHVACAGTRQLNKYIDEHLADNTVAASQTQLVFEHLTPHRHE